MLNQRQPLSIEELTNKIRLSEVRANSRYVYWLQADYTNKGRQYLIEYDTQADTKRNLTSSSDFNIRSGINEYGGGSYWLNNKYLYFFNKDDEAVYQVNLSNQSGQHNLIDIKLLECSVINHNAESELRTSYNYADGEVLSNGDFVCVRQVSVIDKLSHEQTTQELVFYSLKSNKVYILDKQNDFYSFPRVSPNGTKLLWLSWEHPNMPWDHNQLYVAELEKNPNSHAEPVTLNNKKNIIDIQDNSLYQPQWHDENNIYIVSEHNQEQPFWNLYLYNLSEQQFEPVLTGDFELGLPLWQLATNCYCVDKKSNKINFYSLYNGQIKAGELVFSNQYLKPDYFNLEYNNQSIVYIQDGICKISEQLFFLGSTSSHDLTVFRYDIANNTVYNISEIASSALGSLEYLPSVAEDIVFTNEQGDKTYGFFYEPNSKTKISNPLPPLIVFCHGGPTGTTNKGYNPKVQYWTSRGYAVLDVNYNGSTTYGREYRTRLNHNWGVLDVADCASGAEYLVKQGRVNKNKVYIKGSSAGGLVVLVALYKYDIFTAGVCSYPVTDLAGFDEHMHNFEKYYNNTLIGDPKINNQAYISRSPIKFAEHITKPILMFHGLDDKVIPAEQSRMFFEKLKCNNKLNQYYEFPDEGHGFRSPATLKMTLELEEEFYNLVK